MSWIGNGVHFSVLTVASRGKRHSTLSDIKLWAAEECSGFWVLLLLTAGGVAEAAQAGAVFAFRQLTICQGLWRGQPGAWEGQRQLLQPQKASLYLTRFETTLGSGGLLHPSHLTERAVVFPVSSWALCCHALPAELAHLPVSVPMCALLQWLWSTDSTPTSLPSCGCVLWQGYLSPGQMPGCFYCWKGQQSIQGRSTRWLCVSAVKALD